MGQDLLAFVYRKKQDLRRKPMGFDMTADLEPVENWQRVINDNNIRFLCAR